MARRRPTDRRSFLVLVVLLVVLLVVTGAWQAWRLYQAMGATGNAVLDSLRWRAVLELVRAGVVPRVAHARALLSILRNETGGRAGPWIGDETLPGGPSIGPGQVYRATAKDLGLWSAPTTGDERTAYRALGEDLAWSQSEGLRWAAVVYRAKLAAAGGDVVDAVRRYNGGGDRAQAYRDRALTWARATWGEDALA
jgi:hypothetical protein